MAFTGNAHLDEDGKVPLAEMPDDVSSKLPAFLRRDGFGFSNPGTATQIYVSKTGDDTTGDGSSGNPYLTIQKALDSVSSNLYEGAVDIYVGDGTYAENLTAVPVLNAAKNTGYGDGHIHIFGNFFDETAVVVKPASGIVFTSNNALCRTVLDNLTLEGTDGMSMYGIGASAGRVILRNVVLSNCATGLYVNGEAYVQSLSFSTLRIDSDESSAQGVVCEENSFTEFLGPVEMENLTGTHIRVRTGAVFVHRYASMDMIGSDTGTGLVVEHDGVAYIGAGWTITDLSYGLVIGDRGTIYLGGASFDFDSCASALAIGDEGVVEAESCSFAYNNGTPSVVVIYPGSLAISSNIFGGASLVYGTSGAGYHHGYDARYTTLISGHATGTLPSSASNYLTQGVVQAGIYQLYIATADEIIERMDVRMETASGAAKTDTFTVVKNGVDTSMAVGMNNVQTGSTTSNQVSLAAGDRVAIKVASAASTAGANAIAQMKIRKRTS